MAAIYRSAPQATSNARRFEVRFAFIFKWRLRARHSPVLPGAFARSRAMDDAPKSQSGCAAQILWNNCRGMCMEAVFDDTAFTFPT